MIEFRSRDDSRNGLPSLPVTYSEKLIPRYH